MIDTIRELETPEGISLRLRAAGAPSSVRVYPDFASLAELAGLSVELASRSVGTF